MKILVTGAAGFIGSHLCDRLIKEHQVVGIDNLSLGRKENINHLRSSKCFTFHEVDIISHKDFENIFRIHSIDAIFHLAANSDISKGDPEKDFRDTLSTTLVILDKCRVRGIKQLIFPSSGSVYGETKRKLKEDDGPLLPISHYAAAKLSSEAFISAYSAMYNIQSWICRLPNVVGERMTHGAIFDFKNRLKVTSNILQVYGDGNQTKPYMYVKDCVDAMIFIWRNAKERINYFNLSGVGQTSVKEIAQLCAGDAKIIYKGGDRGWNGDVPFYDCDITKLTELGWEPKRTSIEAVKLAIK